MTEFPETLARSVGAPTRLKRAPDLLARRGDCAPQDTSRRIATLEGDAGRHFTVMRGAPANGDIAVYIDESAQGFAVPTGRVFVRFADGLAARDREAAIDAAGYRLMAVPDYAENAAWLEATDGEIVTALRDLDRLAALPDIVAVEPQLLSPRALK